MYKTAWCDVKGDIVITHPIILLSKTFLYSPKVTFITAPMKVKETVKKPPRFIAPWGV